MQAYSMDLRVRVMADEIEGVCAFAGDDFDLRIGRDRPIEVLELTIHLDRERRLGKTCPDRGRDVGAGAAARRRPHRAIWQGDPDFVRRVGRHGRYSSGLVRRNGAEAREIGDPRWGSQLACERVTKPCLAMHIPVKWDNLVSLFLAHYCDFGDKNAECWGPKRVGPDKK